jgi:hypothetical protein
MEFKNQFMTEFCTENNIKQIFGLPYNPRSNSLAETSNKIVRNSLQRLFVQNANLNWCDHLDTVMKSINDTRVYSTGIPRSDAYENNKGKENIKASMVTKGKAQQDNMNQLQVGDKVRVSLSSLNTNLRKKIKEGNQKYVIVTYSYEIYEIVRVYKSKNPLLKHTYQVKDHNGNGIPRKFFQNELLKIPPNTTRNDKLNSGKINDLNNIKIAYIPEPENIVTRSQNVNRD